VSIFFRIFSLSKKMPTRSISAEQLTAADIPCDAADNTMETLEHAFCGSIIENGTSGFVATRPLGVSGWTGTFCISDDRGRQFALELTPSDMAASAVTNAQTLRKLEHKNVIRCHESFWHTAEGKRFFCVKFPYYPLGSLRDLVETQRLKKSCLPIGTVLRFTSQLSSALKQVHKYGLIHGDICPEVILRGPDDQLRLGGFSSSTRIPHPSQRLTITGGREAYAPPEWAETEVPSRVLPPAECAPASYDIWSLGCVISELCTLKFVETERLPNGGSLAADGAAFSMLRKDVSTAHKGVFAALCLAMLSVDPCGRPTAAGLADGLLALAPKVERMQGPFASLRHILRSTPVDIHNEWPLRQGA
jgi:serine/threonine protein kinase